MFPVKFLADTTTLEEAMARVERQFVLDGDTVQGTSVRGHGRFTVHATSGDYLYEWSHINGTSLV